VWASFLAKNTKDAWEASVEFWKVIHGKLPSFDKAQASRWFSGLNGWAGTDTGTSLNFGGSGPTTPHLPNPNTKKEVFLPVSSFSIT
jgi:hypothetical protein